MSLQYMQLVGAKIIIRFNPCEHIVKKKRIYIGMAFDLHAILSEGKQNNYNNGLPTRLA